MNVSLKSAKHNKWHDFTITVTPDSIVLATPCGKYIGRLGVETMECDIKDGDKYKSIPTENFWVTFRNKEEFRWNRDEPHGAYEIECSENSAAVYIEEAPEV